ncbi:metallophosphoesterase [Nocardia sp. NBC_00508]|uniref:metallophosphoesterase n=1 Tax=Nocardia sp. NBC_00508 TaxID=2975992 RepID=UPI002E804C18|nr:metallophosphoesterase [Nocardia sp. NBC_00508]WUD67140.1 metallophosphoesterase [Nocardia sp. NBC_00508]
MVVLVVVGIILAVFGVVAVFGALHWYLWRRLVRDTTLAGSRGRRVGTAVVVAGPLLLVGATVAEVLSAPFTVVRIIAWPGYLWGALSVYLLLALLVGEPIRRLLLRWIERDRAVEAPTAMVETEPAAALNPDSDQAVTREPAAAVADSGSVRALNPRSDQAVTREPAVAVAGSGSVQALNPRSDQADGRERAAAAVDAHSAAASNLVPDKVVATAQADPAPTAATRLPRRVFVSRVVSGAAVAAAATTVGFGAYGVLDGPSVKRVAVPLAKLPRGADGFRITVVSDIHLGPILGRGFAERVVRTVNDTQPDLIAVVGDLVDGSVEHLRSAVEPMAGLRARHGAFFVTGNHEYFSGAEQWIDHVQELGMHLLANARTELPGFDLAGVNDVQGVRTGQGPDFGAALGDRDRTRTAVLLAHQPVLIEDAVAHGVDLQLSGHTHGGQIWPGNYLAGLVNPTVAGLERYGDTQLYVTRGAGAWGPPVRVGAPSDITVVELVSLTA